MAATTRAFPTSAATEALPHADGVSLLPVLSAPCAGQSRRAIMNVCYGGAFLFAQRILITRRYEYVFNGFDVDELYDLETDPGEMVNRVDEPDMQTLAQVLRNELYRQMEAPGDPHSGT